MTDSMKDRIKTDFQKAKEQGKTRAQRIQEIMKAAFSEAVAEVKQGSGEIRLIAKDTLFAVTEKLDDKVEQPVATPVQVPIELSTEAPAEVPIEANHEETSLAIVEQPDAANREVKMGTIFNALKNRLAAYLQQEYATLSNQSTGLKERLLPLQTKLTDRYGDRFIEVRNRVLSVDAKLAERYGDRYATTKQRLENFKLWYGDTLTQAETVGPGLLQQKQTKFETEVVANAGASVAKKEQQIKQQVKQFLQTSISKL
ncbi:hypothetical protein K9N68_23495 [Kovacikia minuta CCNUW1]|uniref:hypothetical protein n=1 Tax=Kovacikia minuta TaxID=2931930 RepID=UPI001CCE743B|nr:hypothetical protein [Kovacikia minuta]UBF24619.1 hypothetical protein K9N68_23495 [Kovacikia minuta CCNUW1]